MIKSQAPNIGATRGHERGERLQSNLLEPACNDDDQILDQAFNADGS